MSEIIDKITRLYEEARFELVVPEWGVTIYWKPYTTRDAQMIVGLADKGNPLTWAAIIQNKAENENGEKLFSMKERSTLAEKVNVNLLKRIALTITEDADENFDELAKVAEGN